MFKPVNPKPNFPEMEKKILKFWYQNGIVEKYLHLNDASEKKFSFIDGPITANNPMGVHHAWGRTYKDLWQRYFNMQGYKQRFQNGFDCQGLWVEVEVEKELGLKNKKEIENLIPGDKKASIAKFVELCKERVKKYSQMQTEQSKRLGYFMDWGNSYYTMSDENNYMIWYFLKVCHQKGWIYKGKDSVPWCPRCETAISQHEMLTEDYKEITHETVLLKLPILTKGWDNTFLLIWTTTPWTIPANVAVGVNIKYTYNIWEEKKTGEKIIILGKDENGKVPFRLDKGKEIPVNEYIFQDTNYYGGLTLQKSILGNQLLGLKYVAPFDHLPLVQKAQKDNPQKFHSVVDASEIVTKEEGTGLLHIAPGAGQEDYKLGKEENLPVISVIDDQANYLSGMGEFRGQNAKKHPEIIIDYLKNREKGKYILKTYPYTHRYPACWRCKTELVWKVTDEWYIAMDKPEKQNTAVKGKTFREQMIEVAKQIRWIPDFGLERELDWLSNMQDWLISKPNRYWGLALPIWECDKCNYFEVIGSFKELQEKAIEGFEKFKGHSPHKPYIDEVKLKCPYCKISINRLPDVGNVWLDAGIVPYSTLIDPESKELSFTSDQKYWREWFPADFITESFPGQFKNWFYALIAESTGLTKLPPFKTVLGFGTLLGEDGRPMHKSWGNSIEFNEGADKIGVDVMRWMYLTHNPEQNLLFGYKIADETRRRFHLLLWNIYNFFISYVNFDQWHPKSKNKYQKLSPLDKWILIRINETISKVTHNLNKFNSQNASLSLEKFVNDLSLWYLRRSRDRVGPSAKNTSNREAFYQTMYEILVLLSKLLAPFVPFLSEEIFKNLTDGTSVHLTLWPKAKKLGKSEKELLSQMSLLRKIVSLGHAERKKIGIKVRQPLASVTINSNEFIKRNLLYLLREELNVKKIIWKKDKKSTNKTSDISLNFNTRITPKLKAEGIAKDIIRNVQQERKKIGCSLADKIILTLPSWPEAFTNYIQKETLALKIEKGTQFAIEVIK